MLDIANLFFKYKSKWKISLAIQVWILKDLLKAVLLPTKESHRLRVQNYGNKVWVDWWLVLKWVTIGKSLNSCECIQHWLPMSKIILEKILQHIKQ